MTNFLTSKEVGEEVALTLAENSEVDADDLGLNAL
jgi:hypothetical protein